MLDAKLCNLKRLKTKVYVLWMEESNVDILADGPSQGGARIQTTATQGSAIFNICVQICLWKG